MPTIRFFCVICGTALQGKTDARDDVVECHSCARLVPVPRLAEGPGRAAGCAPVFPPEVLALEVKFLCTECQSPLRADARWEGRRVACPVCGNGTLIPQWSKVPPDPRKADFVQRANAPGLSDAARLSPDEIDFLSEPSTASPGAGK